jgi:phytoene dehydrogenase-like protein
MKRYDAIVIGSGIGGLTAAALLASGGMRPLVIEKSDRPGGYLASFRRDGFVFDAAMDCISGVGPGGLIRRALELTGVSEKIRFLRVDPVRVSRFPDFDIPVDSSVDAYSERLSALFPSEAQAVKAFFDRIGKAYAEFDSLAQAAISGGFPLRPPSSDALTLMNLSYSGLLEGYFHDRRLKAALSDRCPFIGLPPEGVSAAAVISLMMSYFELGAYRPEGGFQRLADTLVEGIRARGGEVVTGRAAELILLDAGDCCRGVRLCNGEEYETGHVISNADFAFTFGRLLGGRHAATGSGLTDRPGLSTSFFILYAGVEGKLNAHSSMGYYPSYDMGAFFDPSMEFSGDSTVGVTVATKEDRSRAPQGCHTVVFHEMVAASGRRLDKARCAEKLLKKAEKIFPGFRDRITALEAATPSTLEKYTGNLRGAAFGWRQVPGFRGPGRHGVGGLYIAGHWGGFGGGALAAAYSGAGVAAEILAREGVKDVI